MPTKLNKAGQQQNYVPKGNGDASGEYGDSATGSNVHYKKAVKYKEDDKKPVGNKGKPQKKKITKYEDYEKRKSNLTFKQEKGKIKETALYPQLLAGTKRSGRMTFEQANEMRANPNYHQGGGYLINCQSCVVAFEARIRGYDVQALPNYKNDTARALSRQTNLAWTDIKTGKPPDYIFDDKTTYNSKTYKSYLNKVIEKGRRYTIEFDLKGRGVRNGHIICIDRTESGTLRMYDPQNGKQYIDRDIAEGNRTRNSFNSYLGMMTFKSSTYGLKYNNPPRILRIDNMRFNEQICKNIMKGSEKK